MFVKSTPMTTSLPQMCVASLAQKKLEETHDTMAHGVACVFPKAPFARGTVYILPFHLMPCLTQSTLLSRAWVGFSWHGKYLKKEGARSLSVLGTTTQRLALPLDLHILHASFSLPFVLPRLHAPLPQTPLNLLASAPTNLTCFSSPFPRHIQRASVQRLKLFGARF